MTRGTFTLVLPVLGRELRAVARRRFTYWMRVLVGSAALMTITLMLADWGAITWAGTSGRAALAGPELFAFIHAILSAVLLLAAPLYAADCIARERREGTLILLALTPLRPFELVLGKIAAQAVRVGSLWIAGVPILLVPVLMGGVGWVDLKFAGGIQLIIVVGGFSAGVLASSIGRSWIQAAGLAVALTLVGGQLLATLQAGALLTVGLAQAPSAVTAEMQGISIWKASGFVWAWATGLPANGFARAMDLSPPWAVATIRWGLLAGIGLTLLAFVAAVWVAGWRVRKAFRLTIPSSTQLSRRRQWFGPRFFTAHRENRRQRWLATNPARWLLSFSPTAGLGRWGWVMVILLGWTTLVGFASYDLGIWSATRWLPLGLALGMAMAAAASFRREMEEGALELLLVTPLPPHLLVWARARQMLSLFAPAALLCAGLALTRTWILSRTDFHWYDPADFLGSAVEWAGLISILTVPWIGIRYAVRRLHPLNGLFWTMATASILPMLSGLAGLSLAPAPPELYQYMNDNNSRLAGIFALGFGLTQGVLALVWGWLASNDLKRRWYMFRPFQRRPR